jgi:hypothetical protein
MSIIKNISVIVFIIVFALPVQSQENYKIELLPFNSGIFDDFAPVIYKNGIIFCSNRKRKALVNYTTVDNERLLDIYYVKQKDSLKWGRPILMSENISSVFHEGPVSLDKEEALIYFTRNYIVDKKNRKAGSQNNFGIFTASRSGEKWSVIKPFKYNDPDYNIAHPTISRDGNQLFFASDMPGGYGKSDIYYSLKENGEWTTPVNLGQGVNSDSSEMYPFVHESGRIYFASDRKSSMGGLDIYYSQFVDGKWIKPVQLAAPFNSPSDDFAFVADGLFETGFFSSNRGRTDDIFRFISMIPRYPDCQLIEKISYCYEITEEGAARLDTLPFVYEWDLGDGTKKRGIRVEHCYENPGLYMVQLNVIDSLTREVKYNEAAYPIQVDKVEQVMFNSLDTCYVGDEVEFDGSETSFTSFEIAEYQWNFNDGNVGVSTIVSNLFLAPGIYNVQLKVISMPDQDGQIRTECGCKNIVVLEKPPI